MTDRDDELLKVLARAARAEDRASDPRWSARVHGALAPGELDALEALAQRSEGDREAWEASRPLDSEARGRIADRILAGLQAHGGERGVPAASAGVPAASAGEPAASAGVPAASAGEPAASAGVPAASAEPAASAPRAVTRGEPPSAASSQATSGGRVIPLAATSGRARWLAVAAALAAAAAWLLVARPSPEGPVRLLGDGTGEPGALALLSVPSYTVSVAGGEVGQRSASGDAGALEAARLGPGSKLEIALRPATRVEGPVAVRAFLIAGDKALPWDVRAEVSAQGAARIAGDTETLFRGVPEGEWEIAIAIGRPEALPDRPAELAGGARGEGENSNTFHVLRVKVQLLPGAAPPPALSPPKTP
ncbi:hypothetical protein WMF04_15385 [Sorangium sp. So ce260]|uniref:hypothetical protein n=1 Tax=Sorangium sp. So ce260 TaxID=3133291 RepID=UPI003F5D5B78